MFLFRNLIDRFLINPTDETMEHLVESLERDGSADEDLAYLATRLAESGAILGPSDDDSDSMTADIASTGGPSSLSTLLCPLYLRSLGYIVPSLAVPGRPAGGVDVLAQIPGYKVELTKQEVEKVLQKCGYAHFVVSGLFAPLDAVLFSYRKKHGKMNIPDLAIASLLAKKIAADVSLVGLDVRIAPYGNFGTSLHEASRNAARFCRIASLLNRKAICFLNDGTLPSQPFIGRGEALVAMWHALNGTGNALLRKHSDTCYAITSRLAYYSSGDQTVRPTASAINAVLRDNIEAQGSTIDALTQHVHQVETSHIYDVLANEEGFFHVDLCALRDAIVKQQGNKVVVSGELFNDPCGVVLRSDHGDYVRKGDLLATFRCDFDCLQEFSSAVRAALVVKPQPVANLRFLEVVCE